MFHLIRTELLALRSVRSTFGVLAGLVALSFLAVVSAMHNAGHTAPALSTPAGLHGALGAPLEPVMLFALVLGALAITGEYRHHTATQVFLITPRRERVVGAKLAALALAGLALATAGVVADLIVVFAFPWGGPNAMHSPLLSGAVVQPVAGILATGAVFAMIGVGLGALLRHQLAAVVVALLWTLVLETMLVHGVPHLARWLPGVAAASLAGTADPGFHTLPVWGAAVVLLAYICALAALGARSVRHHDVT